MRRRTLLIAGPAAVLLAMRAGGGRAGAQPVALPSAGDRAVRAAAAFQRAYAVPDAQRPGERLLIGQGNPYSYLWPLSQALLAMLALAGMPEIGARYLAEVQAYLRALAIYWHPGWTPPAYASYPPPPNGGGGDVYYDDNAWVAVPLIQYARLSGDPAGLVAARAVFTFLLTGWDNDLEHPAPGGVFWVDAAWNRSRNTVSTAPSALAGLHLYELTRDTRYADWAVAMVSWLNRYLRSPEGLYWDHLRLDGGIDRGIFAYNQGAMIGADLMLERVTGDRVWAEEARRTADAMLRLYAAEGLASQVPYFTALFTRYLLLLWLRTGDARYRRFVEDYAAWAWTEQRDPETDLFRFTFQDHPSGIEQATLWQAGMVQVNALLTWPPERLRLLV